MRPQILVPVLVCFAFSCKETPPEPHSTTIQVAVEDVSCTEALLRVSLTDASEPRTVALKRDGQTVLTARLTTSDSVLIDEGLLPHHIYTYQAVRLRDGGIAFSTSDAIQLTTLDTTSHNFTFRIDTLGDGNSSVLYDVAIINDTLAYAVGEIYKRDSLGNWEPLPYNLAKWSGQRWELTRVTVMFRGNPVTVPLEGIFAHSRTDIWLAGSIPIHGDGINWAGYDIQTLLGSDATVSRMWGTPGEMFFVGRAGNIIRYSSGTWQRVESGTTVDIKDIWGGRNSKTQQLEIACIASLGAQFPQARKLLRIEWMAVTSLPDSGLPLNLYSIWFKPGSVGYLTGSGIFRKLAPFEETTPWTALYPGVPSYHTTSIRANDINDIFIVGDFGEALHFNGISWHSYRDIVGLANGIYKAVAYKGNQVIAVGFAGDRAIAVRGTRQ